MNKLLENNQATLIGTIESKFEFSHETYGEKFYTMQVSAKRLSVTKDILADELRFDVAWQMR